MEQTKVHNTSHEEETCSHQVGGTNHVFSSYTSNIHFELWTTLGFVSVGSGGNSDWRVSGLNPVFEQVTELNCSPLPGRPSVNERAREAAVKPHEGAGGGRPFSISPGCSRGLEGQTSCLSVETSSEDYISDWFIICPRCHRGDR